MSRVPLSKRFIAAAIFVCLALLSGCAAEEMAIPAVDPLPAHDPGEGTVLRIYCWNTEFQDRFNAYYSSLLPNVVTVEWVITPADGGAYQDKLDKDLPNNGGGNPIDIFLLEADYARKYVDSPYTLDLIRDLGIESSVFASQYDYTKEIVTSEGGALKASSWQATPGLFAYRRSIAKDVLGTDDPEQVGAALSDWDKFDSVAERALAKGYKMISGYDDAYRVFSNNVAAPWVDDSGKIVIDRNIWRWVDQTKEYTDKGYSNKTNLWSDRWAADQGPGGRVFGFFYSTWGINFTLLGNSLESSGRPKEAGNGAFGDYAVCAGPQSWYWGGTWIAAAKGTDNPKLAADVIKVLTCDPDTAKRITLDTEDYTNNSAAMNAIAADRSYGSAFLGGQNHIALFAESAGKIDMSNISPYDQILNESMQSAFSRYFAGEFTEDEALGEFNRLAAAKFPELKPAAGRLTSDRPAVSEPSAEAETEAGVEAGTEAGTEGSVDG